MLVKRWIRTLPVTCLLAWVLATATTWAHSPHDVIYDVALSPAYTADETVFVITSNSLMRSRDGGYSWKKLTNGLDHAGQLTSIDLSPAYATDATVMVTTQGDGIYRSLDGGKAWSKANQGLAGLDLTAVTLSPAYAQSGSVFALTANGEVYGSHDRAASWQAVAWTSAVAATSMAVALMDGVEILMVGTDQGQLLYGEAQGQNAKAISVTQAAVTAIAPSPRFETDKTLWLGSSDRGVFQLRLPSEEATALSSGLEDPHITSLFVEADENGGTAVLAASWTRALLRLRPDEGQWLTLDRGLTTDPQAADPYFRMPDFKGIDGSGDTLFLGGYDGLFKSVNGGADWQQLDTILLSGITGLAVHAEPDTQKHAVALATYGAGAYLYDGAAGQWQTLNQGLDWPRLNDIVFSPDYAADGRLFSGSENNFLRYDTDRQAWQRVAVEVRLKRRLLTRMRYYLKKLGIGDAWRQRLLTPWSSDTRFPSVIGVSPGFTADASLLFGTRSSGLYQSNDRGGSNSYLWEAEGQLVTAIGHSPNFTADRTIFAGIYDKGVFRSTNGGKSWERADQGMPPQKQAILSLSPDFGQDRTVFAGTSAGLYHSSDGGNSWNPIRAAALGEAPNIVCMDISPNYGQDRTFIFGVFGRGLWVTTDAGQTVRPVGAALIGNNFQAKFVRFSPNYARDQLIYCASAYEVFRSPDRGRSWEWMPRPIRYEDLREELKFSGEWETVRGEDFSAMSAAVSRSKNSRLALRFQGSGFTWIGHRMPGYGRADIRVDGSFVATVGQRGDAAPSAEIYRLQGLPGGSHLLEIEVNCPQTDAAACGAIAVDAIEVIPDQAPARKVGA